MNSLPPALTQYKVAMFRHPHRGLRKGEISRQSAAALLLGLTMLLASLIRGHSQPQSMAAKGESSGTLRIQAAAGVGELFLGGVYLYNTGLDPAADERHFANLAALGFNAAHIAAQGDPELLAPIIALAARHGIHLLIQVHDAYLHGNVRQEQVRVAARLVDAFQAHPHVLGFSVREEPPPILMGELYRYYDQIAASTNVPPTFYLLHNQIAAIRSTIGGFSTDNSRLVRVTGTDRYGFGWRLGADGYLASPSTAIDFVADSSVSFGEFRQHIRPDQHAVAVITGNTIRDRHPLYALHLRYGSRMDRWMTLAKYNLQFLHESVPIFRTVVAAHTPILASAGYAFHQYVVPAGDTYQAYIRARGASGGSLGAKFVIYDSQLKVVDEQSIGVWNRELSVDANELVTTDFGITSAQSSAGLTGRLVLYRSNERGSVTVDEAWLRSTGSHRSLRGNERIGASLRLSPGRYRITVRARAEPEDSVAASVGIAAVAYDASDRVIYERPLLLAGQPLSRRGATHQSDVYSTGVDGSERFGFVVYNAVGGESPLSTLIVEDAWVENVDDPGGNQGLSFDGDAIFAWTYYRPPSHSIRAMAWLAVASGYHSVFAWSADYDVHYRGITGMHNHRTLTELGQTVADLQQYAWLINRMEYQPAANHLVVAPKDRHDAFIGSFRLAEGEHLGHVAVVVNRHIGPKVLKGMHPSRWPLDHPFRISDSGELIDYVVERSGRQIEVANRTGRTMWDLPSGRPLSDRTTLFIPPGAGRFLFFGERRTLQYVRTRLGVSDALR